MPLDPETSWFVPLGLRVEQISQQDAMQYHVEEEEEVPRWHAVRDFPFVPEIAYFNPAWIPPSAEEAASPLTVLRLSYLIKRHIDNCPSGAESEVSVRFTIPIALWKTHTRLALLTPQSPIPAYTRPVFGANDHPDRPCTCRFQDRLLHLYEAHMGHYVDHL
jgi:hypothetical protein